MRMVEVGVLYIIFCITRSPSPLTNGNPWIILFNSFVSFRWESKDFNFFEKKHVLRSWCCLSQSQKMSKIMNITTLTWNSHTLTKKIEWNNSSMNNWFFKDNKKKKIWNFQSSVVWTMDVVCFLCVKKVGELQWILPFHHDNVWFQTEWWLHWHFDTLWNIINNKQS